MSPITKAFDKVLSTIDQFVKCGPGKPGPCPHGGGDWHQYHNDTSLIDSERSSHDRFSDASFDAHGKTGAAVKKSSAAGDAGPYHASTGKALKHAASAEKWATAAFNGTAKSTEKSRKMHFEASEAHQAAAQEHKNAASHFESIGHADAAAANAHRAAATAHMEAAHAHIDAIHVGAGLHSL